MTTEKVCHVCKKFKCVKTKFADVPMCASFPSPILCQWDDRMGLINMGDAHLGADTF